MDALAVHRAHEARSSSDQQAYAEGERMELKTPTGTSREGQAMEGLGQMTL